MTAGEGGALGEAELRELEKMAMRAADRAVAMIQARAATLGQGNLEVKHKEGGSTLASQVFTEVDLESQRLILETLDESFHRHGLGLLTEEQPDDASRHKRDYFWCIDPLDGTLAFTQGSPGYSVSVALVARDGTPVIGVVHDPVTDTVYHAVRGQGARKNRELWRVGESGSEDEAEAGRHLTLCLDHSFSSRAHDRFFRTRLEALAAENGCAGVEIAEPAGAVMNACRVLESSPALYFKAPKPERGGGFVWDFAATACLFAELGMPVSDFHGEPLRLNPEGSTAMNERGVMFASDAGLPEGVRRLSP